jgi:hypothetical protein
MENDFRRMNGRFSADLCRSSCRSTAGADQSGGRRGSAAGIRSDHGRAVFARSRGNLVDLAGAPNGGEADEPPPQTVCSQARFRPRIAALPGRLSVRFGGFGEPASRASFGPRFLHGRSSRLSSRDSAVVPKSRTGRAAGVYPDCGIRNEALRTARGLLLVAIFGSVLQ